MDKIHYIYEIKEEDGKTIDVGYTTNPKNRMYDHTGRKPSLTNDHGHGRHYGRTDISMVIVSEHSTRKEALAQEGKTKQKHGLSWTEKEMKVLGGQASSKIKRTCPHCGLTSNGNGIKRWHFDNCKNKTTI